jgi:hypothetical protein
VARRPTSNALVAAGTQLKVSNYEEATLLQLSRQSWTERAWSYYENVGEVRYAANFVANSLSRLRLIAAKTPPATSDAWEPLEVSTGAVAEAVGRLQDPRGGQRGLLRSLGLNLFVPGEAFLLGMGGPERERETWECLSSDELDVRTGYPQFFRKPMPNSTPIPLPKDALVIRVWKEHPRWSMLADSAMRTVLDQCETLLLLTRMERAAARSRFAGSGILFIPNELLPSGSRGESDTDFYQKLMESMIAPIKDETHPSSVVPILLTGPAEHGKAIQHITMDRAIEGDSLVKLKEDAVKRLAAAFDLPSEVLTGNTDLNHWGMAVVREETFSAHIQPFAEMVVDALTVSYLHPALKRAGVTDWDQYQIWFDKSGLIQKADLTEAADAAHDRIAISDAAYRKAKGFTMEDAPDEEERKRRIGVKLVDTRLAVLGEVPDKAAPPAPAGGEAGAGGAGRGRHLETTQPNRSGPQGARAAAPKQASERRVKVTDTTPQAKRPVVASGEQAEQNQLALKLAAIDMTLLAQLQMFFEQALRRTAEKAGAKVRSKSLNNSVVRETLDGVSNADVIRTLGPAMVASLGFESLNLVDASASSIDTALEALLFDAYSTSFDLLGALSGRAKSEGLVSTDRVIRDLIQQNIDEAKREGSKLLRDLAHKYLFDPEAPERRGEASSLIIQPGDVRPILMRAGGTAPFGGSTMPGGLATGRTVLEYADSIDLDVRTTEYIWVYGETPRQRGFQSHMQLDGAIFTSEDDPVLHVWPEDKWLRRTYYAPGDHRGCACVVVPVLRDEDGSLVYQQ